MIQYIMELISAICVDGLNLTHSSASLAVGENLGRHDDRDSLFLAWTTRLAASGCASTAFDPT